ncbi:hypothetical protein D7D81_06550 [Halocella sp. SP3-1]|nr:hypothetical protein D7D81_06550 [Halocella sp. SP3-1]
MKEVAFKVKALVGIDIGTTNIKVIAFSVEGKPLITLSRKNVICEENGYFDFDGNYIFKNVLSMINELVIKDIKIESIGISSLAETVFPIFKTDISTIKSMVWYDRRTNKIKESFFKKIGEEDFFKITGLKPQALYSIFKIGWYYENENEFFSKAIKWLPVNSYLGYQLTGAHYIDYTMLSRTGALDIKKKEWSDKIFSLLPFNKEVFPDFINSGEKIGFLKKRYKNFLGIDYDIPVSLGGHDHICGNYAVAAFQGNNVIMDSMGTAENIQAIVNLENIDLEKLFKKDLFVGLHVIPDKAYIYRAFHYSGGLINNLISLFFNKPIKDIGKKDFEQFNKEASRYLNKETEINFFIEDNKDNITSKDLFLHDINIIDIPLRARRGEVFMAGIRYLGKKGKEIICDLEKLTGIKAEVVAIGGSTRNELLMKEKARIIKRNLYINQVEEAVTLGAALLGGVGAGIFKDYREAVGNISREKVKVL